MPIVFFCSSAGKYPIAGARAHFMRYIFFSVHFNSIHFNSILFYSAWRKLRNVTNDNEKNEKNEKNENYEINEKNENYEILRKISKITKYYEKKGNTLIKNHVSVIFYAKTVYFFIHVKNVFIAFFLFFVRFPFFR